ncbi:unnamed protein product [Symbiodinium sp. CCMP2456]|nr:unnamed protein product [Symbiodinium sp. CCMP2456]
MPIRNVSNATEPLGLDWQARGPPAASEHHESTSLSSFFVPLLLSAAGLLEDAATWEWEGLPWFRTSREALTRRRQRGAVAALAIENHYLTASSQESLLLSFAGDAGAAQISRGAAALGSANASPNQHADPRQEPDVDAHIAHVAGETARASRARGRGRRGRGGRGRGRRQRGSVAPGDPAAPTQIDTDSDADRPVRAAPAPPSRHSCARTAPLHSHLQSLRDVALLKEFENRIYTFQSPPRQLRGLLRNALRVSLEAIRDGAGTDRECEGWKLFLLAPRMLLYRTPGTTHVPPEEIKRRERLFCDGQWTELLRESAGAAQQIRPAREPKSACPQKLALKPTSVAGLTALRDPARRPPAAQARRGAAAGPSGCTNEHLRVLMDEEATVVLLGHAAD